MNAPLKRSLRRKPPSAMADFYLFGPTPLDDILNLQRRLAYESFSRDDGRIAVLLSEHETAITIGRGGSRDDLLLTPAQLEPLGIEVQEVARGGGAVLHGPGQLCGYVIAPLERLRWSVGSYLHRLHTALAATLDDLAVKAEPRHGLLHLWGRSGLLAALGIGVRHGTSSFGFALNVAAEPRLCRKVRCVPGVARSFMGSLLTERAGVATMASVRSSVAAHLATSLGCNAGPLHVGHPLLPAAIEREPAAA
jgi:lipoyl(octanoyl) transferase